MISVNFDMNVKAVQATYPINKEFVEFVGSHLVHMQKDYEDSLAYFLIRTPSCLVTVYEGEYLAYLGKEIYQVYDKLEIEELVSRDVEVPDEEYNQWYAEIKAQMKGGK